MNECTNIYLLFVIKFVFEPCQHAGDSRGQRGLTVP